MGAGVATDPHCAGSCPVLYRFQARSEDRPCSTTKPLSRSWRAAIPSLFGSAFAFPSRQRHRPVVAALKGLRDDGFRHHSAAPRAFRQPQVPVRTLCFDLRLGSATVTGPSIQCFLQALTPAIHSGCEKKAVTLF